MPVLIAIKALASLAFKKSAKIAATTAIQELTKKAVDELKMPKRTRQVTSNAVKRRRKERKNARLGL